jgi:hypothetical protein
LVYRPDQKESRMKKPLLFTLVFTSLPVMLAAQFTFSSEPIAWGFYIDDELVITTDVSFTPSEYFFRDDGTGVKTQIVDGDEVKRGFTWSEVQTSFNLWGKFAFLSQNLFHLTFDGMVEYIDISSDFRQVTIYSGAEGEDEDLFSFYISDLILD